MEKGPTGRCTEPTPGPCSGSSCSVQAYVCTTSDSSPKDKEKGMLNFSTSSMIIDRFHSFTGSTMSRSKPCPHQNQIWYECSKTSKIRFKFWTSHALFIVLVFFLFFVLYLLFIKVKLITGLPLYIVGWEIIETKSWILTKWIKGTDSKFNKLVN